MGWMQDTVSPYPTTGNSSKWAPLYVFVSCVYFYLLAEAEAQLHVCCRDSRLKPAKAASLQQFHFAHWLLSWVLCDCNWLESLKLASPCQPWKLWNHKAWYSYQARWSLMACRVRASRVVSILSPTGWTRHHSPPSGGPCLRWGALSRAFSFPSVKPVSGWTDLGLIRVGSIGKWEQMGRRVK